MVDVYWDERGKYRYLQAGEWSLDPDSGEDTIESLRADAEALDAAADFLQEAKWAREAQAARDREDGKAYATRDRGPYLAATLLKQRKPFWLDEVHLKTTIDVQRILAGTISFPQQPNGPANAPLQFIDASERLAGYAHATGGKKP